VQKRKILVTVTVYDIASPEENLTLGKDKIRLLVVDDTKFMRKALKDIFSKDEELEVVCTAKDGEDAIKKISEYKPDVITLDIDMPTMDGLTALKHIMMKSPVPVVMVSALADNPEVNFEIWRLGSIEFVKKPSGSVSSDVDRQKVELIRKVKQAYFANLNNVKRVRLTKKTRTHSIISKNSAERLDLILGGAGSLNNIIYLLSHYKPEKFHSLLALLDFNLKTLSVFQKRVNDISLVETYLADKSMIVPETCCIISSINNIKKIEYNDGNYFIDITENESSNSNMVFDLMPDKIYQDSSLFVLNSTQTTFIDGLGAWVEKGGRIFYQDPSTCIFPQLINHAISENIKGETTTLSQYIENFSYGTGFNV
jgi:two-component system chemotaxis response regulator CheB